MGQPRVSTCTPWADLSDVCAPCDDYQFDPALLEDCLQMASDILYGLAPIKYPGVCEDIVRPCARRRVVDMGPPSRRARWSRVDHVGWHYDGTWLWGACTCNRERVGCYWVPSIRLGGSPIVEILEVKVDGEVVPPDEYRIDNFESLVRLPKDGVNVGWPCCQHVTLPDTEVGTWSVRSRHGVDPPLGGTMAAASLGCQLALSFKPVDGVNCRLPRRVQSMTRQGVTVQVADWQTLFEKGLTGLSEVDLWLASERAKARNQPAMFVNPETVARRNRRVGT